MEPKLVVSVGEYDIYRTSIRPDGSGRYSVYVSQTDSNVASNLTFENAILVARGLVRKEAGQFEQEEFISPTIRGKVPAKDIYSMIHPKRTTSAPTERERLLRGLPDIPVGIRIRRIGG